MVKGVRKRIEDMKMVIKKKKENSKSVMVNVEKEIKKWKVMVRKMKDI